MPCAWEHLYSSSAEVGVGSRVLTRISRDAGPPPEAPKRLQYGAQRLHPGTCLMSSPSDLTLT